MGRKHKNEIEWSFKLRSRPNCYRAFQQVVGRIRGSSAETVPTIDFVLLNHLSKWYVEVAGLWFFNISLFQMKSLFFVWYFLRGRQDRRLNIYWVTFSDLRRLIFINDNKRRVVIVTNSWRNPVLTLLVWNWIKYGLTYQR